LSIDWDAFNNLPQSNVNADIHCVTAGPCWIICGKGLAHANSLRWFSLEKQQNT